MEQLQHLDLHHKFDVSMQDQVQNIEKETTNKPCNSNPKN